MSHHHTYCVLHIHTMSHHHTYYVLHIHTMSRRRSRRSYVYAVYVPIRCTPYMYALYVCLRCMPYMYALYVCLICMPYMYALYECLTYRTTLRRGQTQLPTCVLDALSFSGDDLCILALEMFQVCRIYFEYFVYLSCICAVF